MSNLANTHHVLRELSEAKELKILVLEWHKRRLGPAHPTTILTMENLACILRKLGEVVEAEELLVSVEELRGTTEFSY
jgi:hypothetical protein